MSTGHLAITETTGSVRRPRWMRLASASALASVLGFAVLSPVATPIRDAVGIVTVDWQDSGGHNSTPWVEQRDGQDGTSSSTTTVNFEAATAEESTGVVLVDTVLRDGEAAGTGIVLSATGEILTNYHVVEGSTSIKVTVASTGTAYTATVVGHDQTDDIALLQLKDASDLATAPIDDDSVATGDQVTAVGNAGGTGALTAATGTVTALRRSITTDSEGATAGETLTSLIETDADVVPGDSGGPLLDTEGEVIGIDTAASSGAEIDGYAIPIGRALSIVKIIVAGAETATVTIGAKAYLGVEIAPDSAVNDFSDGFSAGTGSYRSGDTTYQSGTGAYVASVVDGGPAADGGLTSGDTITSVAGDSIANADDLTTALAGHEPGDKVLVTWIDSMGDSHTAEVTLGASPLA